MKHLNQKSVSVPYCHSGYVPLHLIKKNKKLTHTKLSKTPRVAFFYDALKFDRSIFLGFYISNLWLSAQDKLVKGVKLFFVQCNKPTYTVSHRL